MNNNNVQNTTQSGLTNQSVFGLTQARQEDLCIIAKKVYNNDEKVTVSQMEFFNRLNKKVGYLFDDDFDWSNMMIAGGLISGLLEKKYNSVEYASSDVDIFVYGSKSCVVKKIQYVYDYFVKKLDKKFYAFVYIPTACMVNIIIPGKISIQIIGTLFKSEMEVLESFDMTHCQVGYNGSNIVATNSFINSMVSRITYITKTSIHAYRLVKAYRRGYSIADPEKCYIKNIFHEYTSKEGDTIPSNTDKIYDIHNLQNIMEELENNPIVIQNLTKNYIPPIHHELYTKEMIDQEMQKIGNLYAGKDKYLIVNNYGAFIFIEDITPHLHFVRIPFLC